MATSTTSATNAERFLESARVWDAGWSARDVDQLLSNYADDVVWEDPSFARPIRGKAELRRFLEAMLRAFPDIEIRQEHLFRPYDGDEVFASQWVLRGTFRDRLELPGVTTMPLAPTGDRVEMRGMALLHSRDGLGYRVQQFPDYMAFQRQIGALPPQGSRGEKLLGRLQALGARRRLKRNSA